MIEVKKWGYNLKKKVCHITSVHNRYDIRIFEKECVSLANAGYDVVLVVNDDKQRETRNKVTIESLNAKYNNRLSRILFSKRRFLKKVLEVDADIYHFHDPELLPLGHRLKKMNKKVIYDSHEDVPVQILAKHWIPVKFRKLISFLYGKYEHYISKKLDAIVTVTPHIYNRFSQINNNTVKVANFPLLHEFIEMDTSWNNKHKVACYIGGISKNRGIIQIAEAMKSKDVELILCGKFESDELEDEVLQNYKNIKYLGVVDRKTVAEVIKKSLFGFVTLLPTPNHIHSYPIKMFEYMAGGIPVIASDFPLWRSIVEGNDCGICVDPYDINAISDAIDHMLSNEEEAIKRGHNGKNVVLKKYEWGSQEKNLLDLYNKII